MAENYYHQYDYGGSTYGSPYTWGESDWQKSQLAQYAESLGIVPGKPVPHGEAWDKIRTKLKRYKDFLAKSQLYAGQQAATRKELLGGFRQYSESAAARGLGDVLRQQRISDVSRGLEQTGGIAGRGTAAAVASLRGLSQQGQQQFSSQLMQLQAQNRDLFVRGQFEFMNAMDKMAHEQAFERAMVELQAKLQQDAESRNVFYSLAGGIGQALGIIPFLL